MGGTHLTYFILRQLPVLPPATYAQPCPWLPEAPSYSSFITPRVLELTYTAWDLKPFAADCGYDGAPFVWDEARRFLLRCELDAAYFHLYGMTRDDAAYILETFPIVKRKDEATYGEYRTKQVILEIYDAMAQALAGGAPYRTRLDPPPADPRAAHHGAPPDYLVALWAARGIDQPADAPPTAPAPEAAPQAPAPTHWGAGQTPLERLARIRTLSDQGTRQAVAELTVALTDTDTNVCWAAGSALLARGGETAREMLEAFLKHAISQESRSEAQRVLKELDKH